MGEYKNGLDHPHHSSSSPSIIRIDHSLVFFAEALPAHIRSIRSPPPVRSERPYLSPMAVIHSDIRSAFRVASAFRSLRPDIISRGFFATISRSWVAVRAFNSGNDTTLVNKVLNKPSICTADELHYVSIANSDWRLALWRYTPPPHAPPRNHPLLLLSGVGTNAIGYDLSPESSFARHMSSQGFDTWVLEVRGAGLSIRGSDSKQVDQTANAISDKMEAVASSAANSVLPAIEGSSNGSGGVPKSEFSELEGGLLPSSTQLDELELKSNLADTSMRLSERLSGILSDGQLKFYDLQDRLLSTIEDFQKQLDLVVKYDWDFDHYLEEDVPAAMEYVRSHCMHNDGKLLAIGHSMGGILLYAMLSRCGADGQDSNLAGVVTLASSVDYTTSKSTLRLLLPLADPAQALNVPVVPLGTLLAAAYRLSTRPPYVMSWLNNLISSEGMMHPELMQKFILNNFCTIPTKLLLQLTTAFRKGGLCNREGTFFYKDHLHKTNVPILALAGDQDLICPPDAVYETAKLVPKHLITYQVFGEPDGPHYAHYDLVGGKLAREQMHPRIIEFLSKHDSIA
ncbi:hypothetical protein QQ045_017689 [Rhodiola kirilowii]